MIVLRDSFIPQTITRSNDGVGGFTEAWTDGPAFNGLLTAMSASRRLSADKTTVYGTDTLICRASVSLSPTQRIKFGSRIFQIRSVSKPTMINLNKHFEVDLLEVT